MWCFLEPILSSRIPTVFKKTFHQCYISINKGKRNMNIGLYFCIKLPIIWFTCSLIPKSSAEQEMFVIQFMYCSSYFFPEFLQKSALQSYSCKTLYRHFEENNVPLFFLPP